MIALLPALRACCVIQFDLKVFLDIGLVDWIQKTDCSILSPEVRNEFSKQAITSDKPNVCDLGRSIWPKFE